MGNSYILRRSNLSGGALIMDNSNILIRRDGNAWCAHRSPFVNLQECEIGYGATPQEALQSLLSSERHNQEAQK